MTSPAADKIILGIDPGTHVMGYALLQVTHKTPALLVMGVLQLHTDDEQAQRLRQIQMRVEELVREFHPNELAIESPYVGLNPNSFIKLCRAQGVVIAEVAKHDISVTEYPPAVVKKKIVGHGGASKEQVAEMIRRRLHLEPDTFKDMKWDATDALAIAYTHFLVTMSGVGGTLSATHDSRHTWQQFVNANPERVSHLR